MARYAEAETANGVADLIKDGAELQLSRHAGDGVFGSLQRVFVDDVDERYETFISRGLDTTQRPESPVHTAPVDQTWGLRETWLPFADLSSERRDQPAFIAAVRLTREENTFTQPTAFFVVGESVALAWRILH